jgi:hypothetical protein
MDGRFRMSTATPRASTRTPISPGTSASSIGVEAIHLPSLQWLNTTLRCPGCRVTLSVDPRPRASGIFRRVGPTPQLWTFYGVVSRFLAAPGLRAWGAPRFAGLPDAFVGQEWPLQKAVVEAGHVAEPPAYSSPKCDEPGTPRPSLVLCLRCGVPHASVHRA